MEQKPDSKIVDFLKRVRKEYKLEKAIFFGSRARGDNFKDSDYDIILVSKDFNRIFFTKRIAMMYNFWKHYPLDIEPICYTPEEFKRKSQEIGIVREAIRDRI